MKINWKYTVGSLLALLGFGSCDRISDIGGGLCMYGQPTAHFRFVGDVKDSDGKAIPGIRVVVSPRSEDSWLNDTLYTDPAGHVEKDRLKYNWPDEMVRAKIKFEDVDGEANGSFKKKEMLHCEFDVKQTKKGDGEWYEGEYTVQANAMLEKVEL
jgi:putative lipoprotein (rSAM/lipoprotein system)